MTTYKITVRQGKHAKHVADQIFTDLGAKMVAQNENDIVNGHVTCVGDQCDIVFYDQDEAPNSVHKSTHKKAASIPFKILVEEKLRAAGVM